jgi:hypothetical protein
MKKRKELGNSANSLILLVPRAGLEPAQPQGPRDFKSLYLYFHHLS